MVVELIASSMALLRRRSWACSACQTFYYRRRHGEDAATFPRNFSERAFCMVLKQLATRKQPLPAANLA
jgi:hypothetical protein